MMAGSQRNVILLGAPGAGKGTQADRVCARFGLPHISTGDMFRAAVAQGTEMGLAAKKSMDTGALVPDEVVIGIVRDRLAEPDAVEGFLLDGFPRTIEQAASLDAMLAESGRGVTDVLLLDVPESELAGRLAGRRLCRSCGKGYHIHFYSPRTEGVCDACDGELLQRDDDNETTVRKRLEVYRLQTQPLVDYYDQHGVLETIVAGDMSADEVFGVIEESLGDR
jgi:adenylate kinase